MSAVDPITREIIANALMSAAREMGVTMRKTSTSPIFNEGNDYSCAVFDSQARLVAHGETLPVHLGSMPHSVRNTVDEVGRGNLRPDEPRPLKSPIRRGVHLPHHTPA